MNRCFWLALILVLLALPNCIPGTSVSTSNSTSTSTPLTINPTSSATGNSTAIPNPSDWVPRITIQDLLQKMKSSADILVIDTRVDVEVQFSQGHIPGAEIVTLSQFLVGWAPAVSLNREIILY
jgi:hypothetical protein